jgi:hypothetical protein
MKTSKLCRLAVAASLICHLPAQSVIAEANFPRLARTLDYAFAETETEWWTLHCPANFGSAMSSLTLTVAGSSGPVNATLNLPFNRNGSIIPVQVRTGQIKRFLVCGGEGGPGAVDGVTGKIAVVTASAGGSGPVLQMESVVSVPSADPIDVLFDPDDYYHGGPVGSGAPMYVVDYLGSCLRAGVATVTATSFSLPSAWVTVAHEQNTLPLARILESRVRGLVERELSSRPLGSATLLIANPGHGWGDAVSRSSPGYFVTDINQSVAWNSGIVGDMSRGGFRLWNHDLLSARSATTFAMPGGLAGSYELWDVTGNSLVASASVGSGPQLIPAQSHAFAFPGHRFKLRQVGSGRSAGLWLPVRYGAPQSQIAGFNFERVLCEMNEAQVGSTLFGFACKVDCALPAQESLTVHALINLRSYGPNGVDDHLVDWQGTSRLIQSFSADYQLSGATMPPYVGIGLPIPDWQALENLVVLCQFVATDGANFAVSDVIGVGIRLRDASPEGESLLAGPEQMAGAQSYGGEASAQLLQHWSGR